MLRQTKSESEQRRIVYFVQRVAPQGRGSEATDVEAFFVI